MDQPIGRTIQVFLVDGTASGLTIATMHGWTGSVLVARNQTLPQLLSRSEAKRTGVYILHGRDPDNELKTRVYIGEADSIVDRLPNSVSERGFWELAAVVTTSDESLTKGHVRYLEAELIRMTSLAGRSNLDNGQRPDTDRRYLPEADRANMQAFLANMAIVLPVVGFEFLKPVPQSPVASPSTTAPEFVIEHYSGVTATMMETEDAYIVKKGSLAAKDANYAWNSYSTLRQTLIKNQQLFVDGDFYRFADDIPFDSPSAAAAVVLDRNANGRTEWKVSGTRTTYDEWQRSRAP